MNIAVMTPSRSRPRRLYKFFDSLNNSFSGENKIDFFISVDNDDPELYDYQMFFNHMQHIAKDGISIKLIIGKRKPLGILWNDMAKQCQHYSESDLFIMGNDDLVYNTVDWDVILKSEVQKYPDGIFVAWGNDLLNGENLCAFPIVTKKWIDIVGYFVPEIFEFLCHDIWVFDIAKKIDRCIYIPQLNFEHLHFSNGKSAVDETYAHWRNNGATSRDYQLYLNTESERDVIASKLKSYLL